MKVTGTVEYRDLEGGTWQLAADDGKRYTLLGSKSELRSAKGARGARPNRQPLRRC